MNYVEFKNINNSKKDKSIGFAFINQIVIMFMKGGQN